MVRYINGLSGFKIPVETVTTPGFFRARNHNTESKDCQINGAKYFTLCYNAVKVCSMHFLLNVMKKEIENAIRTDQSACGL